MTRYDAIVVGAGQAGLAAGYYLQRAGSNFVILEGTRVGNTWERRWDSLRLFTPVRYNALPGMDFPGAPYDLPGKDDVAAYLRQYARHFALPVREGTGVRTVRRSDGEFQVATAGGELLVARSVIVATGANQRPYVPELARAIDSRIVQVHSDAYRDPSQLPQGRVLVVGAGNSGAQIALELANCGRQVLLAGPIVGWMPRRLLGRDIYDWIWPTLLRRPTSLAPGRRQSKARRFAADPLIGIPPQTFARAGIARVGRVVGAVRGVPLLDDGSQVHDVAAIVWCTGFRPDYSWLELPAFGLDGHPLHDRGIATGVKGLGFIGMRHQSRLRSALLGGVGDDARHVVARLVAPQGRHLDV